MNIEYSKAFTKAVKKLSGKLLESVKQIVIEVKQSENIENISDCKKLIGYNNVYRKRIGDLRAFFVLHIEIDGDKVVFEYLVSRGQADDKKTMNSLRNKDS
jgi:mRNA-degrading endonuclease RelE of RelBE toxin-antitoxin system